MIQHGLSLHLSWASTMHRYHRIVDNQTKLLLAMVDHILNIARGTMDPEIDSVTWIEFINNMAPLALVAYLATIWRHLH